ncbi:MAG: TetR/AcrR family transcriptional regulator [Gemmatimonadetes bacterium]|nr:TetR/AcrR family transcriptional regulator [Gemmatimonadota bacterium]
MPKVRQERSAETRGRVLAAARELFRERGFDETSADQIAKRAGVAKGTVFLHGGSKERLLLLVFEADVVETATRALDAVRPAQTVAAALQTVFTHFFRLYERDMALARRFVKEQVVLPHQENPLAPLTLDFVARLADLIAERQASGEVHPDLDARLAAQISYALYSGVLVGWLSGWIPDAALRDRILAGSLALHWS